MPAFVFVGDRLGRYILEGHPAFVQVHLVGVQRAGEVHVNESVVIQVANGNTSAVVQVLVPVVVHVHILLHRIAEGYARARCGQAHQQRCFRSLGGFGADRLFFMCGAACEQHER